MSISDGALRDRIKGCKACDWQRGHVCEYHSGWLDGLDETDAVTAEQLAALRSAGGPQPGDEVWVRGRVSNVRTPKGEALHGVQIRGVAGELYPTPEDVRSLDDLAPPVPREVLASAHELKDHGPIAASAKSCPRCLVARWAIDYAAARRLSGKEE